MACYIFVFLVMASLVLEGHCGKIPNKCFNRPKLNATLSESCMQETEVTQETVDKYANLHGGGNEPTEDFYCYLQCIFIGVGVLDKDGVIEVELFKSLFEVDEDCLKDMPKIIECSDMKYLERCNDE